MRHLCKITLLIIIMTLTTATASADKYGRAWKKVEQLIEQDLPESAAKEINNIWDMAAKNNDGRQMLKAAVYLTRVRQTYDEKSILDGIDLFNTLLPTLKVQEHQALCHAFLAKGYMTYWERNKYNISRSLPQDDQNPQLQHWTARMICDTICYHLDQSINLAGDVGSGFYEEFFPGGNKAGQKLRPLLVDMLADHAVMLITDYRLPMGKKKFLDDERLYGSMRDFLEATRGLTPDDPDLWQFYVLRRLVNNNFAAKPNIRCTIDIRRMQVLNSYLDNDGKWDRNDEEWLKGTIALAESYTKKVKFSTLFYSMAARKIEDNKSMMSDEKAASLNRQAHDICLAAQKKWPKSEGALECMAIKMEIERKTVDFEAAAEFLPGERNVAIVNYRNVSTLYIKVVEVPGEFRGGDEETLLSQINQCNVVSEWSMHVNDPVDYMEHPTMITIPPVMQGSYYLMVSTGPYFGRGDCIAYRYVECNGIKFVRMVQNNGTVYGVAVNTRTGKPIPDCKYTLWRLNNQGDMVQVVTSGITDKDGVILLENYNNNRYRLELEAGTNRGNDSFYLPWRSDMPDSHSYLHLYTDRYTYLPGDSVQFNGVLYNKYGERAVVMADEKVKVYAMGSREEKLVGTFTTDEMGVFCGTYHIPDNYMPGKLSLRAEQDYPAETYSGWIQINVESFRQPKFQVSMDEFRDDASFDSPITVTGRAMTYTGVPLDSATVQCYAGASPYSFHRFCLPDDRGYIRVGSDTVTTSDQGTFSFTFSVPSDMMVEPSSRIYVNAIVTDINGETHEASLNLSASQKPGRRVFILSGDGTIPADGVKTLHFALQSDNGRVSGRINVKVSRLGWLEDPGLPLPFDIDDPKYLAQAADNLHLKEKFPRYDFDFNGDNITESVVFDGVVPFDRDDPESGDLMLDNLTSGVYRITVSSDGVAESHSDITLCREDDYGFVKPGSLLWSLSGNGSRNKVELGDTAVLRLGNSRKGSVIHYFIENKYGLVRRGMLESDGRQQVLSIPVTPELKGYFAVSCAVVYEGVTENTSYTFEVPEREHQLKMELTTFRSLLEPNIDEEWNLRITDWEGNPVKAAIMLDMYDRALDVYGYNAFMLQPFSPKYVGGSVLLNDQFYYTRLYEYRDYRLDNKYEYRGKRAVTGILIDPFRYNILRTDMLGRVKRYSKSSALSRQTGIDNGLEETLLDLGITTVDEALQGRVSGLDIVFDSGEPGSNSQMRLRGAANASMAYGAMLEESALESTADQTAALRTDLNPTGLFRYIVTDSTGKASVQFRSPQLLTEWRVRGLSFTDSLKTAMFDTTLVTRKLIMVEPASPRFLREGDRMEFTVKVSNLMEKSAAATVTMTMTDAVTGKTLGIIQGSGRKNITVPAGGSASTAFTINVPNGLTAVTYRLTAQTQGHSDGMEETIPVLANRTQVTQALSLFNNGAESRTFHFEVLDRPRSNTMQDELLTLEYSATPIWYAIQNLPVMIRLDDISTLSFYFSMMGSAISQDLCRRYPVIREMLDEWSNLPVSAWQTQLERNEDLTGTLLEETPWVMDNRQENDRLHALAKSLGSAETERAFEYALNRLVGTQNPDGGWSWIPNFLGSSIYVTREIMSGLGLLIENGIIDVTSDLNDVIRKGLGYLDSYYYKRYDVKEKPKSLGYEELSYLLIRSYFQSYPFGGTTKASHQYFTRLADMQDTHDLNLYFRAQLALLMARTGKEEQARHIAETLVERSLYSDEMGRYWRDNAGGYYWYDAPIETQALIIRMLLATGYRTQAVEAARWLLKQKQTTGWGSGPATAAAVTALMATGGNTWLESDPDITIYVGKDAIKASTSRATAGYTTQTWQGPISCDKADITVQAKTDGISWGAVYRTFTERLDKVEHQENGMTLKRTIWRVIHASDGDRLEEVKPGTRLHVGDQLRIRFDLETDRNLEYLQLSDMRAATMEPLSTHAGYTNNWRAGIRFYSAPGNTRNVFYIDRLDKGTYTIEYDVKLQKPGRFTVGNAVMQCLYAPAFRATTTSAVITVE